MSTGTDAPLSRDELAEAQAWDRAFAAKRNEVNAIAGRFTIASRQAAGDQWSALVMHAAQCREWGETAAAALALTPPDPCRAIYEAHTGWLRQLEEAGTGFIAAAETGETQTIKAAYYALGDALKRWETDSIAARAVSAEVERQINRRMRLQQLVGV
jgi:hypothetical protein